MTENYNDNDSKNEEKKLEAKNPRFYSVGAESNTQSPFAVPEQTENKGLGDPVKTDFERKAVPRMSYRYESDESLPSRNDAPKKQNQEKKEEQEERK